MKEISYDDFNENVFDFMKFFFCEKFRDFMRCFFIVKFFNIHIIISLP